MTEIKEERERKVRGGKRKMEREKGRERERESQR